MFYHNASQRIVVYEFMSEIINLYIRNIVRFFAFERDETDKRLEI